MTHPCSHLSKRQRLSVSLLLAAFLLTITTSAQDISQTPPEPSPTVTLTHTPMPTQPTATPTITPLPDPTLSAIMSQREPVSPSNIVNLREFYRWPAYEESITSLVFMPDGSLVTTGWGPLRAHRYVQRWSIRDGSANPVGEAFPDLATGGYEPYPIQLSDDGQFLSVATGGAGVLIWDALTTQLIGHVRMTYTASAVIYEKTLVLIGGSNGLVTLWSIDNMPGDGNSSTSYRETGILPPDYVYQSSLTSLLTAFRVEEEIVQVAHDRNTSFILTRGGILYLYTWSGSETLTQIRHNEIAISDEPMQARGIQMVLDRDRQQVYYAASSHFVIGYDYAHHYDTTQIKIDAGISCLALSPENDVLIIGDRSEEGTLGIYNPETYELIAQIDTGHTLASCIFNQDGTLLALGDTEGQIALWGVSPG
jgi:WD40 repeat protein